MPAIHENLRQIRQARGLTQEDAAGQIGVTRQTISSYESNRTQPDLETLKRLAEVYSVEFNDILYGTNRMQKKLRSIKIIAIVSLVDLLLCNLAQSVLIYTANTYFRVESGMVTQGALPVLNARIAVLNARRAVETVSMASFGFCCVVLLFLLAAPEHPVSPGAKLKYFASLVLGSAVTILPWPFLDPVYGLFDYGSVAAVNLIFAAAALALSFLWKHIHKRLNGGSRK